MIAAAIEAIRTALAGSSALEVASVVLGLAYSLLAVRRTRWCWVAGGASSAALVYLAARGGLPMQAGLQAYYVGMSVYGFWQWSRSRDEAPLGVTTWPWRRHLAVCAAILLASVLSAHWLAAGTQAAWPFLDSLTTWASLFATWLVARMKLENWLYWIAIDVLLVFLFAAQDLLLVACLNAVFLVVSIVGFFLWRRNWIQATQTSRLASPASHQAT